MTLTEGRDAAAAAERALLTREAEAWPPASTGWGASMGHEGLPSPTGGLCFLMFLGSCLAQAMGVKDPVGGSSQTHRVAGVGPLHLGEASHVRVEYIHLLYEGGECRLGGLADLLINTFGLRGQRRKRK